MAAIAALGLRLFFILKFPGSSGDTAVYEELANNWMHHGIYGVYRGDRIVPVTMRLPGYPAFLAAIHAVFGPSARAVMLVQALIDVAACFLIAALAARFVRDPTHGSRTRAFLAALWLAALCPFTANYTAVVMTETLAMFLGTLALVLLLDAFFIPSEARAASPGLPGRASAPTGDEGARSLTPSPPQNANDAFWEPRRSGSGRSRLGQTFSELRAGRPWLFAGLVAGLGTLVRPETPLLIVAAGIGLVVLWRRRPAWPKLGRAAVWMVVGLLLPLLPWAARNWHTFRTVQFLAPRYAEMPGDLVPKGFYQWTHTWLVRFPDVYNTVWKIDDEAIKTEDLPYEAFDNPGEQARVAQLLDAYNQRKEMTPAIDAAFAEIARERTAGHPWRTYVWVPLERAGTLWFWPRIELLPYSGQIFPLDEEWSEDRTDLLVTLGLGLLGFMYVGAALFGLWVAGRNPAVWLAITYVVIRTAFLTQIETPEPRYVLAAYPVVLALAACALARHSHA